MSYKYSNTGQISLFPKSPSMPQTPSLPSKAINMPFEPTSNPARSKDPVNCLSPTPPLPTLNKCHPLSSPYQTQLPFVPTTSSVQPKKSQEKLSQIKLESLFAPLYLATSTSSFSTITTLTLSMLGPSRFAPSTNSSLRTKASFRT